MCRQTLMEQPQLLPPTQSQSQGQGQSQGQSQSQSQSSAQQNQPVVEPFSSPVSAASLLIYRCSMCSPMRVSDKLL